MRLIIPSNWVVQTESVSVVMASIEDKREQMGKDVEASKKLILKGLNCMGGIEIKSY
jgi:hypothetical protein